MDDVEVLVIGPQAHRKKAETESVLGKLLGRHPIVKTETNILNSLTFGAKDEDLSLIMLYIGEENLDELGMLKRLKGKYPTTPVVSISSTEMEATKVLGSPHSAHLDRVLCKGHEQKKLLRYFSELGPAKSA